MSYNLFFLLKVKCVWFYRMQITFFVRESLNFVTFELRNIQHYKSEFMGSIPVKKINIMSDIPPESIFT